MRAADGGSPTARLQPETRIRPLFIGLLVTMLLAALNQNILSAALPTVVGDLDGIDQMTWVVSSYLLAATISMPVYGKIGDLFGRKPLLLFAIGIFVLGAVLCATAQEIEGLIAGRAIQGVGGGGLLVLSQAAIADVVPARDRGRYMGVIASVYALSSVAGPLIGGWLTEGPGWRWAFWICIPLGVLAATACSLFLNAPIERPAIRPKLDYLGTVATAALTGVVVLIGTWGGSMYQWFSASIISLMALAGVLIPCVVIIERRASEPILPPALFRDRNFVLTTSAGLLIGIVMFGTVGYMPTYLQMGKEVSATHAGMLMISLMGGLLTTSVVSGVIVARTGRYKFFPIAGTVLMAIGLVLVSTVGASASLMTVCAYLAIFGIGIGMTTQILTLIVQNSFPPPLTGTATAGTNYFRQVGASLGSAVVGSVFATRLASLLFEKDSPTAEYPGLTPESISLLPDVERAAIVSSYGDALLPVFFWMFPLVLISTILLSFIKETPLSREVGEMGRRVARTKDQIDGVP